MTQQTKRRKFLNRPPVVTGSDRLVEDKRETRYEAFIHIQSQRYFVLLSYYPSKQISKISSVLIK